MFDIYYDRTGKPLKNVIEWAKLAHDKDYCRVAYDTIKDGRFYVSTIWLGIDHNFTYRINGDITNPHPLIFETMVFDNKKLNSIGTAEGIYQERYSTEADALGGHKLALARYKLINNVGKMLNKK